MPSPDKKPPDQSSALITYPQPLIVNPMIALPQAGGLEIVSLREIIYCEASSNYTLYHLYDRKVVVSRTLKDSEDLLSNFGFVRVHQSYLVNLSHVRRFVRSAGGSVIMSNLAELTVSPRRREALLNALIRL